jgi:hypothetical protein
MAAKKAATKSRSSKSNKNKTNLKWWYVLPVIAIVAVAGYAIVRFSEAGTATKRPGSGLTGGVRTIDKGGNEGRALEIGSPPNSVRASWSQGQRGSSTRFCARAYASNGDGNGGVTLALYQGNNRITNPKTTFFRGTRNICTNSLGNFEKARIAGREVNLRATNASGYASVISMYVAQ